MTAQRPSWHVDHGDGKLRRHLQFLLVTNSRSCEVILTSIAILGGKHAFILGMEVHIIMIGQNAHTLHSTR